MPLLREEATTYLWFPTLLFTGLYMCGIDIQATVLLMMWILSLVATFRWWMMVVEEPKSGKKIQRPTTKEPNSG